MDCGFALRAPRNDKWRESFRPSAAAKSTRPHPRARFRAELCLGAAPRNNRGRREGRVPVAPMVRVQQKSTRQNHRYEAEHPAFPARLVLTAYTRSPRGPAGLPPYRDNAQARCAGPQHREARTTRFRRPQNAARPRRHKSAHDRFASTAFPPHATDDPDAPLGWTGTNSSLF
jgi:hypothetical protein